MRYEDENLYTEGEMVQGSCAKKLFCLIEYLGHKLQLSMKIAQNSR